MTKQEEYDIFDAELKKKNLPEEQKESIRKVWKESKNKPKREPIVVVAKSYQEKQKKEEQEAEQRENIKQKKEKVSKQYKKFRLPETPAQEKYYAYLVSKEWKELKKQILERDGNRCQWCGDYHSLNIHHLTYDRVFHEDLEDLITLCSQCHENYHKRKKYAESQGKPFD